MSLRLIPGVTVFRPADANETAIGWQIALANKGGPTALALTRQGVPTLDRSDYAAAENAAKGGYVLADADDPAVILIASGSEVHIALEARAMLAAQEVPARVVSMPSWELFDAQPLDYREGVLPPSILARVSIEAGVTIGWERYVGPQGKMIGLNRFGASAPYQEIYRHLGLTAEAVAAAAKEVVG
jgi:transketolase